MFQILIMVNHLLQIILQSRAKLSQRLEAENKLKSRSGLQMNKMKVIRSNMRRVGTEGVGRNDKEAQEELEWRSKRPHEDEKSEDPAFATPRAPYPELLVQRGKDTVEQQEIYDVFSKCQINLPLLTAIRQVPRYARYLKDLCTIKRKLHVKKKSFLAENVSAIVQNNVQK